MCRKCVCQECVASRTDSGSRSSRVDEDNSRIARGRPRTNVALITDNDSVGSMSSVESDSDNRDAPVAHEDRTNEPDRPVTSNSIFLGEKERGEMKARRPWAHRAISRADDRVRYTAR
jgi:hypothetical protein